MLLRVCFGCFFTVVLFLAQFAFEPARLCAAPRKSVAPAYSDSNMLDASIVDGLFSEGSFVLDEIATEDNVDSENVDDGVPQGSTSVVEAILGMKPEKAPIADDNSSISEDSFPEMPLAPKPTLLGNRKFNIAVICHSPLWFVLCANIDIVFKG